MVSGSERASELLSELKDSLRLQNLTDQERTSRLAELKVIGRDPKQAAPIFTKESSRTLGEYAFDTGASQASREAMRCLANAMLLNERTRQDVIDLDLAVKAADRMGNDDRDDEFLTSRILFFATYTVKLDIPPLFEHHALAQSILSNLDRAVKRLDSDTPSAPITNLALQETLKLIYNLTYYSPESATHLRTALSPVVTLLLHNPPLSPPLQPPTTQLIAALLNLNPPSTQLEDATVRDPLFPPDNPTLLTTHLTNLLSSSLPAVPSPSDDATLAPLLSLLRTLHSTTPHDLVRASLRSALLPSPSNRSQPLGTDTSLPSRLLRAATSPATTQTRDVISALLYEVSGSDPRGFVRDVGYGYAVGLLARLGVEAPAADAAAGSEGPSTSVDGEEVNPVTGQWRRDEARAMAGDDGEEMTEEEKEREAERLFVLFERLKATGVVDVKNPVELAREQGRLEEVDDDD